MTTLKYHMNKFIIPVSKCRYQIGYEYEESYTINDKKVSVKCIKMAGERLKLNEAIKEYIKQNKS